MSLAHPGCARLLLGRLEHAWRASDFEWPRHPAPRGTPVCQWHAHPPLAFQAPRWCHGAVDFVFDMTPPAAWTLHRDDHWYPWQDAVDTMRDLAADYTLLEPLRLMDATREDEGRRSPAHDAALVTAFLGCTEEDAVAFVSPAPGTRAPGARADGLEDAVVARLRALVDDAGPPPAPAHRRGPRHP